MHILDRFTPEDMAWHVVNGLVTSETKQKYFLKIGWFENFGLVHFVLCCMLQPWFCRQCGYTLTLGFMLQHISLVLCCLPSLLLICWHRLI